MSEIKVDTLTGKTTANDITVTVGATATQSLEQGLAKGWANVQAHGSFNDSLNMSSVSDVGTGQSTLTFTNNYTAANYCPTQALRDATGTDDSRTILGGDDKTYSTSQYQYYVVISSTHAVTDASQSFSTFH